MIKAKLSWNTENVRRYVKYSMFHGKNAKLMLIIYIASLVLMAAVGIVAAALTGLLWMLALSAVSVLLMVAYAFVLWYVVKRYASDIVKINSQNAVDGIEITSECFTLYFGNEVKGAFLWDKVASVDFDDGFAYITTINGLLFIIKEEDITEGSLDILKKSADKELVKQDD